jgi:hypothetical protein
MRLLTLGLLGLLTLAPAAAAQTGNVHVAPDGQVISVGPDGRTAFGTLEQLDTSDARRVRFELAQLLRQHPPSLRTVLQADPSLLEKADYLAPYPKVAEYLRQHPEVARDPQYFLGSPDAAYYLRERTPAERALETLEMVLLGLALFTGFMAGLFVFGSLIRQAILQRRWTRQSRVQTEVHTKILDRLQSNDELLAYIQTPAGQRFLQSGPSPLADAEPRTLSAPFGRIFWSVQAGVMLVALGIGFWFVQRSAMAEIAPAFNAMGALAAALGIGAIVSGVVSYLLSVRFGLLRAGD